MSTDHTAGRDRWDHESFRFVYLQPSGSMELEVCAVGGVTINWFARHMVQTSRFLRIPVTCVWNDVLLRAEPGNDLVGKKATTWQQVIQQYEDGTKRLKGKPSHIDTDSADHEHHPYAGYAGID